MRKGDPSSPGDTRYDKQSEVIPESGHAYYESLWAIRCTSNKSLIPVLCIIEVVVIASCFVLWTLSIVTHHWSSSVINMRANRYHGLYVIQRYWENYRGNWRESFIMQSSHSIAYNNNIICARYCFRSVAG